MRRLISCLTVLALAGCTNPTGSVIEPPSAEPIAVEEPTMLACRYDEDTCLRVSVISDGVTVERMRGDTGDWIMIARSDCRDGYCHVVDEYGIEWKLEP